MICSKSYVTEHAHEPDPDPRLRRLTRATALRRSPNASCPPSSGAGAARRPTRPAVSSFRSARSSTTAGRARKRRSRSRPRSPGKSRKAIITRNESPGYSVRPLDQPLSRLRARLLLLLRAADPRLYGALRRARFRNQAVRQGAAPRRCWSANLRRPNTGPRRSPSAPTPTPISRSSGNIASPGR